MINIPASHYNYLGILPFFSRKEKKPVVLLKWHMVNIKNFNAKMSVFQSPQNPTSKNYQSKE